MTRCALILAFALLVGGCATAPPPPGGGPTITRMRPNKVRPLRWVWIDGHNLNGRKVEVLWTGGARSQNLTTDGKGFQIHVEVPTGARSGKVVVRVDGVDSTPGYIEVLPPRRKPPY